MKVLSYVVGVSIAICGMSPVKPPASTVAADITGTWQVTVHTPPPGDAAATFVLKQDGAKISGTYDGYGGAEELTGTINGNDVVLIPSIHKRARWLGKVKSATQMSGTLTGASSTGNAIPWDAEKKSRKEKK
jgi:hypothetical protein